MSSSYKLQRGKSFYSVRGQEDDVLGRTNERVARKRHRESPCVAGKDSCLCFKIFIIYANWYSINNNVRTGNFNPLKKTVKEGTL